MTECAFCLAISTDGEPTSEYRISGAGSRNYRFLCVQCAKQLERLGMEVAEVDPA